MKPAEVLGMLEEAAGTRMYENKKEAALRTLEKKQVKVDEINKVGRTAECAACSAARCSALQLDRHRSHLWPGHDAAAHCLTRGLLSARRERRLEPLELVLGRTGLPGPDLTPQKGIRPTQLKR
jgi:hypothetical protein